MDRNATKDPVVAEELGGAFFEADVTDECSVAAAIVGAVDAMDGIAACVNCTDVGAAGKTIGKDGPLPLKTFDMTIDINLVGSFNVARLAAAGMAKNAPDEDDEKGVIINTASIAAFDGQKGQVPYSASKGGIVGITLRWRGIWRATASE